MVNSRLLFTSLLELGGGNNTASMTCTTPLSAKILATVTLALFIKTPSALIVTCLVSLGCWGHQLPLSFGVKA